jgi:hypothetical protein
MIFEAFPILPEVEVVFGTSGNADNGLIFITQSARRAGTITKIESLATTSGSINVTVQINGIDVTGLTNVLADSTATTFNASADNVFDVSDEITIILSSNSSASELRGSLIIAP